MFRKIYLLLQYIQFLFREYFFNIYLLKSKKQRIILMGIPSHGNVGDQAIVLAEEYLFSKLYPDKNIIKISYDILCFIEKLALPKFPILKDDVLFLHGGGNLGTLYLNEEVLRRKIISRYADNKIVIMPMSIFFHDNEIGNIELKNSVKCYTKHKNLKIITRDENSYNFARKHFRNNKIYLLPDVVNVLDGILDNEADARQGIVLFLRQDKEKVLDDKNINKIVEYIKGKHIYSIITDTIEKRKIYNNSARKKSVLGKIRLAKQSRLVITDRYHGMIFAVITKTPVIVFKSYDSKISSGIKWFRGLDDIYFMKDFDLTIIKNILLKVYDDDKNNFKENYCKEILFNDFKKIINYKNDFI